VFCNLVTISTPVDCPITNSISYIRITDSFRLTKVNNSTLNNLREGESTTIIMENGRFIQSY